MTDSRLIDRVNAQLRRSIDGLTGRGLAVGVALLFAGAGGYLFLHSSSAQTLQTTGDPVISAAGNIACDPTDPHFAGTPDACQMRATADVVKSMEPRVVLPLGDIQYDHPVLGKLADSYQQSWGRFKSISRPVVGELESSDTDALRDYFYYFGEKSAGYKEKGYYSYNIGTWHLVALNSSCGSFDFRGVTNGCDAASQQLAWLKADLDAHRGQCTLAYWHVPYYSSGESHAKDLHTAYRPFWQALYDAHADVVLSAHDSEYERFAKQDADGHAHENGVRQFVVGTGGHAVGGTPQQQPNSEALASDSFGVLKLTLRDRAYDWQFVPIGGGSTHDSGTASCNIAK